jgi:hypothetical protein
MQDEPEWIVIAPKPEAAEEREASRQVVIAGAQSYRNQKSTGIDVTLNPNPLDIQVHGRIQPLANGGGCPHSNFYHLVIICHAKY